MKSFGCLVTSVVLAVAASSAAAQSPPPPLTLRQAIDQALGKNPAAAVAKADQDAANAAAKQARTAYLPLLGFTEDISRGNDPVYVFGSRLRQQQFTQANFALNALNRPQPIGDFVTRFKGSWMAFDSFQTQRQIHRADLFRKSAASASDAANQQIVIGVVSAYQSVLYAERALEVAQHEQQTAQALLNDVSQHVKAGLAVDSDRMAAEVNVAARKQELIAAQGNLDLAWADLRLAMGVQDLPQTALAPIQARNFPDSTLDQELADAAKNRPDLKAMGEATQAQKMAVAAARSAFGPQISAYGNWEQDRPTFAGAGGNNWVAGVQLNLDILPIGKRDQLARERAGELKANAQLEQARQQLRLDVSRAHIQRQTAELQVATARAAMSQAAENLRIIRNRYTAGLATITDLLRAEDANRASQSNYWRAVYGNATAYAQLLFAEGLLTPGAAEDLQ